MDVLIAAVEKRIVEEAVEERIGAIATRFATYLCHAFQHARLYYDLSAALGKKRQFFNFGHNKFLPVDHLTALRIFFNILKKVFTPETREGVDVRNVDVGDGQTGVKFISDNGLLSLKWRAVADLGTQKQLVVTRSGCAAALLLPATTAATLLSCSTFPHFYLQTVGGVTFTIYNDGCWRNSEIAFGSGLQDVRIDVFAFATHLTVDNLNTAAGGSIGATEHLKIGDIGSAKAGAFCIDFIIELKTFAHVHDRFGSGRKFHLIGMHTSCAKHQPRGH